MLIYPLILPKLILILPVVNTYCTYMWRGLIYNVWGGGTLEGCESSLDLLMKGSKHIPNCTRVLGGDKYA